MITKYTLVEILVFIFIILAALKEGWSLIDFFRNKIKKKYETEVQDDKQITDILNRLKEFEESIQQAWTKEKDLYGKFVEFKDTCEEYFKSTDKKLEILTQSDKDNIKSWIVEKHHFFMKQEWIDDFNMDAIEKRFTHYEEEGGNSYICDLMKDLRKLPNYPPM